MVKWGPIWQLSRLKLHEPVVSQRLLALRRTTCNIKGINIRCHPYPPRDFAVGGRLLVDRAPAISRLMKRLSG